MTVDDADDADRARLDLVVHRVRHAREQEPTPHDRQTRSDLGEMGEGPIHRVERIGSGTGGPDAIPLECPTYVGSRAEANDEHRHSAQPGAGLVADRRPRDAGVGVRIALRLTPIQFGGQCGGERDGGSRVQTVPETADERDALLGRQGFEGLGLVAQSRRLVSLFDRRNAGVGRHNASLCNGRSHVRHAKRATEHARRQQAP